MKPIIPVLLVLFAVQFSSAQQVEKYFDYAWRECPPVNARYYSLTAKTDSGWPSVSPGGRGVVHRSPLEERRPEKSVVAVRSRLFGYFFIDMKK